MVKLSALVLTQNEQEMIKDCLKQLDFVQEIIVLDQGSTDATVKLASKYTDKIYKTQSDDFSKNRNKLASLAFGEWILYVDADERFSPELIGELVSTIDDQLSTNYSAFYLPRKNFILGTWLKHGGWWPDYVPRLIKRDKLISWQGKVHESPKIEGEIGYLKNPLDHLTARDMSKMLKKSIQWAKVEAELYHKSTSPKVTVIKVIKACLFQFLSRYIVKLGFLDGQVGFIAAIYQSVHKAMILTYLWELQTQAKEKFRKINRK